jgi:diaminopimelate epimerase
MISFVKMQAQGNDFVVVFSRARALPLSPAKARRIADRRLGVGCDQILLLGPSRRRDCDFSLRIFNPDGGEAGQCGNGARCVALFLRRAVGEKNDKKTFRLQTKGGVVEARALSSREAKVNLGTPRFAPADIPLSRNKQATRYRAGGLSFAALSLGNPHAVIYAPRQPSAAQLQTMGDALNRGCDFPEGVNVGVYRRAAANAIFARVYERGVAAETPACGSGAAAAAIVAMREDKKTAAKSLAVKMPGGDLRVEWDGGGDSPVYLRGAANFVFSGEIN